MTSGTAADFAKSRPGTNHQRRRLGANGDAEMMHDEENEREQEEERIREFAYRIWQEEGFPDGQAERHWEMARQAVAAERADRLRNAVGLDGPEKK
jgi:hypothetical protein